jgi:hypothetical protein
VEIAILPPLRSIRLRLLLLPSTVLIVLSNLVPLAGVLWWNWDAFLVLILYWCETAAIAFWTMARILLAPPAGLVEASRSGRLAIRIATVVFFTFHAGVFMAVHLLFLWSLFSGSWRGRISGFGEFVGEILIQTGLWLPLAVSFAARGIAFFFENRPPTPIAGGNPAPSDGTGTVVGGLYGRIVVMHITILAGAVLAQQFGSLAPLALLIVLKTLFDVAFHLSIDVAPAKAPPRTSTA